MRCNETLEIIQGISLSLSTRPTITRRGLHDGLLLALVPCMVLLFYSAVACIGRLG